MLTYFFKRWSSWISNQHQPHACAQGSKNKPLYRLGQFLPKANVGAEQNIYLLEMVAS
jgi:hypothetical protein